MISQEVGGEETPGTPGRIPKTGVDSSVNPQKQNSRTLLEPSGPSKQNQQLSVSGGPSEVTSTRAREGPQRRRRRGNKLPEPVLEEVSISMRRRCSNKLFDLFSSGYCFFKDMRYRVSNYYL